MSTNNVTDAVNGYLKGLEGFVGDQANITAGNVGDFFHRLGHNTADAIAPQKLASALPQDNQPPVQQPSLFEQTYTGKKPIDTQGDNHIYSSYNIQPLSYLNGSVADPPIAPDNNPDTPAIPPAPDIRPTQPNTLASSLSNNQVQPQVTGNSFFSNGWTPKFASIWQKYAPQAGITPDMVRVLVTSENGKEDPTFPNTNGNGTTDVGLTQLNVPSTDTATIERLKNPDVNVKEGVKRLAARMNYLGDPVLALASWNLGAKGAITNPQAAIQRAQTIYRNAGVPLPQTPFTQDPQGFISQNMDKYKKLGLL